MPLSIRAIRSRCFITAETIQYTRPKIGISIAKVPGFKSRSQFIPMPPCDFVDLVRSSGLQTYIRVYQNECHSLLQCFTRCAVLARHPLARPSPQGSQTL